MTTTIDFNRKHPYVAVIQIYDLYRSLGEFFQFIHSGDIARAVSLHHSACHWCPLCECSDYAPEEYKKQALERAKRKGCKPFQTINLPREVRA